MCVCGHTCIHKCLSIRIYRYLYARVLSLNKSESKPNQLETNVR
jgi:hypothetical protein